jgi:hypothetical protein
VCNGWLTPAHDSLIEGIEMRQIWITRRGGPEVLQVREAADPVPKEGEVRIRVAARRDTAPSARARPRS